MLVTAEDAVRLARLPGLGAYRAGRPRKTAMLTVWHDSPGKALSEAGVSLSETRGEWRLEALHPKQAPGWFPATPPPLLAVAVSPDLLPLEPFDGIRAPIAAFSGHRRDIPLRIDGHPARLTLLEGDLRGVVETRPVCRVVFSGPPQAMAKLAVRLSAQIPLGVPLASLGAQAVALATGTQPQPRHRGGPEVAPGSAVGDALAGITAHLADVVHHWAPRVVTAETEEPVHQMRVALRRLRSALSIFRRAVRDDTTWLDNLAAELKTLAATLGVARDWDVFLAGIGAEATLATGHDKRLTQMLAAAARKRDAAYAALRLHLDGSSEWQHFGLTLALLPTLRPWDERGSPQQAARLAAPVEPYAAHALEQRLKHVLGAGENLEGVPAEQLHEIRKQAKRLRYAIEFFAPLFPEKQVRRYLSRLEDLQEDFGIFNDAAVAAGLAASLGAGADRAYAAGVIQGFGAAAQLRASRHVVRGWSRFYRATPFWA